MGKFTSTQYKDLIGGVTDFHKDLLNQDFYLFNSQGKGTEVEYYNINTDESTLDPAAKIAYSEVGVLSPIRYNLIHNFFIYGIPKLETNLENQDFGIEAYELTGESYIMPGTITPMDGDFFTIDHDGGTWLYKVTDATPDTLSGGQKAWKINWKLDRTSTVDIDENIVKEFIYNEATDGTNTKRVVELTKYELAKKIDIASCNLKEYFKDLFYSDKVQSFIYKYYNDYNMYDPYAIEFIIKNKLLYNTGSNYIHVSHISQLPKTFGLSYDKSIFKVFELRDKEKFRKYSYRAQADYIEDPTSIFATRYEMYWMLTYDVNLLDPNGPFNPRGLIPVMTEEEIEAIHHCKKYNKKELRYKNIIVKYFNNKEITEDDLETLDDLEMCLHTYSLFYDLLFLIFCLDYYVNKLLN
jgi:hypothetical protein